jgi:hypothetical protein
MVHPHKASRVAIRTTSVFSNSRNVGELVGYAILHTELYGAIDVSITVEFLPACVMSIPPANSRHHVSVEA